jgi:hypothetical protein
LAIGTDKIPKAVTEALTVGAEEAESLAYKLNKQNRLREVMKKHNWS